MAEKTFDTCTNCGKKAQVSIIDDETRLCEDCFIDLDYIECDNCTEAYLWDAIIFYNLKNGDTLCEHCGKDMLDDGDITEDDIESISDFT